MELSTFFMTALGLVGLCHLAFSAAQFLGKGIYSEVQRPAKCDEWYCFFKTADLLGSKKGDAQADVTREQLDQRRQHQRRRMHL